MDLKKIIYEMEAEMMDKLIRMKAAEETKVFTEKLKKCDIINNKEVK